jgi:hypothetical protein
VLRLAHVKRQPTGLSPVKKDVDLIEGSGMDNRMNLGHLILGSLLDEGNSLNSLKPNG